MTTLFKNQINRAAIILLIVAVNVSLSHKVFAGKGVGAGGGTALTRMFSQSLESSQFFLENLHGPASGKYPHCDQRSIQLYQQLRSSLLSQFKVYSMEWAKENDETTITAVSCVEMNGNKIVLYESKCRESAVHRRNATQLIFIGALTRWKFPSNSNAPLQLSKCISEYFEDNFWRFAWSNDETSQITEEIVRRASRLGDSSSMSEAGNHLSEILQRARKISATILLNFSRASIPSHADPRIINWLSSGSPRKVSTLLAEDILASPHNIMSQTSNQNTCAYTYFEQRSQVNFSVSICKANIESIRDAIQTVVHESAHHAPFLIKDEILADKIGETLADIYEANPPSLYHSKQERLESLQKIDKKLDDIISTLNNKR